MVCMIATNQAPKFNPGQVVATQGVAKLFNERPGLAASLFHRHVTGDWGDCSARDKKINEDALEHGARLMSVFKLDNGPTVWAITEADRSVCTFLFPEDY